MKAQPDMFILFTVHSIVTATAVLNMVEFIKYNKQSIENISNNIYSSIFPGNKGYIEFRDRYVFERKKNDYNVTQSPFEGRKMRQIPK